MKKILILVSLMLASQCLFAASGSGGRVKINSLSWSLLYGYTESDNDKNFKPGGQSYKLQFGNRWDNNFETNFLVRYASQKKGISFENIGGEVKRTNITGGLQFGYWIFSAFNLHAGYALHNTYDKISASYTNSQTTSIKSTYGLKSISTKGLFAGVDLVLLQGKNLQLFTNYEYYHLNHAKSHEWEAMVGIRLYPGSSNGAGSSSSFFNKFFEWFISKNGK